MALTQIWIHPPYFTSTMLLPIASVDIHLYIYIYIYIRMSECIAFLIFTFLCRIIFQTLLFILLSKLRFVTLRVIISQTIFFILFKFYGLILSFILTVVFWLVNTSSCNNKTNHDMWGNIYIYRKEYLQERDC